ncbi:MAG: hypothetical protein ACOCV2_08465, partial [Persicimonas sp.]
HLNNQNMALTAGLEAQTDTYDYPPESRPDVPTAVVDSSERIGLAVETASRWEATPLGERSTDQLLERLLEAPLHTDPFAGAARLGDAFFFIAHGLVYGAVDVGNGQVGDRVHEALPERAPATLYPVPDSLSPATVMHLASLLYRPQRQKEDLDNRITDLPRLAERLEDQEYDGAVCLETDTGVAYLLLHKGRTLLEVFGGDWPADPRQRPWQRWIGEKAVTAHVEKRRTVLPAITYRRELADLEFERVSESDDQTDHTEGSKGALRVVSRGAGHREGRASTIWRDIYRSDRNYQLLRWMLHDLDDYLRERRRFEEWKYLSEWLELIERARLYHHLPRPGESNRDFFDLVTFDEDDKVLHLARRLASVGRTELEELIDDVTAQKKARHDTGDIGGVILMADHFEEDFHDAYRDHLEEVRKSWMFSLQDSVTGYEGFIRIGARRGFHLLPIQYEGGAFNPLFLSAD